MKKWFASLTLPALFTATVFAGTASAATTKTCDNDPSSTACHMYLFPSGSSHWAYTTASGSYSGDHRINATSYSSESFDWEVDGVTAGSTTVKAYLASSTFTNRSAAYDYGWSGLSTWYRINNAFDQYNAPSGWNTIGSITVSGSSYTGIVSLGAGGTSGGNTGADAIQIVSP